eukprot:141492_1
MFDMFDPLIELRMDDELISELQPQDGAYKSLPIWSALMKQTDEELKSFEQMLYKENMLAFDTIFNEPLGYYFFSTLYLSSQHATEKAMCIRDVNAFKSLSNNCDHDVRKKLMYKICNSYFAKQQIQINTEHSKSSSSTRSISLQIYSKSLLTAPETNTTDNSHTDDSKYDDDPQSNQRCTVLHSNTDDLLIVKLRDSIATETDYSNNNTFDEVMQPIVDELKLDLFPTF